MTSISAKGSAIFIDLERRCATDLLPDREAETLSGWLKVHPVVEIVSRDRSPAFASGTNDGAPQVVQVADRWQRLKNVRDALEQLLVRQNRLVRRLSRKYRSTTGRTGPRRIRVSGNHPT
jgi:transposase